MFDVEGNVKNSYDSFVEVRESRGRVCRGVVKY